MLVSGALFAHRVRLLVGLLNKAQPVSRSGHVERRVRNEATIVLGQSKLLRRLGPGLAHAFIFWGFLVLLPTILIAMIGVVDFDASEGDHVVTVPDSRPVRSGYPLYGSVVNFP